MFQYNPSQAPSLVPLSPTTPPTVTTGTTLTTGTTMSAFIAPMPTGRMRDDDDDILMDYEDEYPAPDDTPMTMDLSDAPVVAAAAPATPADEDEVIVPERIHIRGVDNLSTGQVTAFIAEHSATPTVRLEWIDDTSLNAVYETPAQARAALAALTSAPTPEELPLARLRPAKLFSAFPDARLSVRISKPADRKVRGARERSRYYLFHPEEDRIDRFERERRDRDRRPRRPRDDDQPARDGDYSRRYYDSREDGVRRRHDEYADDMYDDRPRSRSQPPRPRSRSRSPPPPPRHRDPRDRARPSSNSGSRRRSRSPVELFPERRSRSKELFPLRAQPAKELFPEKRAQTVKELFPHRTSATAAKSSTSATATATAVRSSAAMDNLRPPAPPSMLSQKTPFPSRHHHPQQQHQQQAKELFPDHRPHASSASSTSSLSDRATAKTATTTAAATTTATAKPRSLAERISLPPRSLADRISAPPIPLQANGDANGGAAADATASPSDDLFARKMMAAKGEGLGGLGGVGGSGGRRRRGRKKADEFM